MKYLRNQLKLLTENSQEIYYLRISKKHLDPSTIAKTCRSIGKTLLNNKKILCVPTLFHQNTYVTEFRKKAGLLNCFFAKQCFIINSSSELLFNLCKKADKSISTITFASDDIATIIQNIDPNKAQGHHMLSIRMMTLCGEWICKPLGLIF